VVESDDQTSHADNSADQPDTPHDTNAENGVDVEEDDDDGLGAFIIDLMLDSVHDFRRTVQNAFGGDTPPPMTISFSTILQHGSTPIWQLLPSLLTDVSLIPPNYYLLFA